MKFSTLFIFLLVACSKPEERKIEPEDEYVLVEFAARLEEEQEKFGIAEKEN